MRKRVSEENYSLNYTYVSSMLSSKMTVELPVLGGKLYFKVISISDVKDLIRYFCDQKNEKSFYEDFVISSLFKNGECEKIATFVDEIDEEDGLREVELSELEKRSVFNDFYEIFFDRRILLSRIDWEYLLTKVGYLDGSCPHGLRLRILDKIREVENMSYPECFEGIVELKYIAKGLEYNKRLKPYKSIFKDSSALKIASPRVVNISKAKVIRGKKVSRTALGSMIESYVISELQKGNSAKPLDVWKVIASQSPLPDPITEINKIKKVIHHHVPTTADIEYMPYKTFQNRVNEYRDAYLGEGRKIRNPAQLPSKRNIPDQFPPRK